MEDTAPLPLRKTARSLTRCCAMQAFGPLLSCRILTDPKTGISRCAGLLRFETPEQARHAIRDMHGRQVCPDSLRQYGGQRSHALLDLCDAHVGEEMPRKHETSQTLMDIV